MTVRTQNNINDVNGSRSLGLRGWRPVGNTRCSRPSSSETLTPPPNHNKIGGQLTVGTWNVRTLFQAGKLELLRRELGRLRCDIVRLSEVRWTGTGEQLGGRFIYTGEETAHERGVRFMLSDRAHKALIEYIPVSARVIVAKFQTQCRNISVVWVSISLDLVSGLLGTQLRLQCIQCRSCSYYNYFILIIIR